MIRVGTCINLNYLGAARRYLGMLGHAGLPAFCVCYAFHPAQALPAAFGRIRFSPLPGRAAGECGLRVPQGHFPREGASYRPAAEQFVESPGELTEADTFPRITFVRWTRNVYNDAGEMTAMRRYHAIPGMGPGREGENYDETRFGFDIMNRGNMTRGPSGTIVRKVFDVRDNAVQIFVGTDDTGATDADPTGGRIANPTVPTTNNMVNTVTNIIDGGPGAPGVGGNNLLTSVVRHIGNSNSTDYRSDFVNDWRNRRQQTTDWIVYNASSVVKFNTFDNNDQVTLVQKYNTMVASGALIGQSGTAFDWLQRAFQTQRWAVTVGTGALGNILTGNTWFNALNLPVKQIVEGAAAAYTKTAYDLAVRVIGTYSGYSPGANDDPWTIGAGDKIFEQTQLTLDAAGHTSVAAFFQRHNGDDATVGPLVSSYARMAYTAFWQDGGGRAIATANYGTANPGTPDAQPESSAWVLVSATGYNNRGEPFLSTDPEGTVARSDADDAGREVRTIQNYVPERTHHAGRDEYACPAPGNNVNVTTLKTYTPDDNVAKIVAVNPVTGDQITRFLFGVTLATSAIARTDLLVATIYPDAADALDLVQLQYNLQSEVAQMRDQNGNVHQYVRDQLGRETSDKVTTLGPGVDGTVQRIDTGYDIRGMANLFSSYSLPVGGSLVNQVSQTFDSFEQLQNDSQNPGAGGPTLGVAYGHADGSTNTIALISVTYPNARQLCLNYASGDDASLNRVTFIAFVGESLPLVTYGYFGVSSFASVTYNQPGVANTLASGASYPGLDLFGRVVDLSWAFPGGSWSGGAPGSGGSSGSQSLDLVNLGYGYNRASSRTHRADFKAAALGAALDEKYANDALQRLIKFHRGALVGDAIANPGLQQAWKLDAAGNWSDFTQFDPSDSANTLDQRRTSNRANEIIDIGASVGSAWATPAYDRNGNMTTIPQPGAPTATFPGVFDAWNRLVALTGTASYVYDALHRRVASILATITRYFYHSSDWQVLEERISTSAGSPNRQYVWGLRYIDDLVIRDRSVSSPGALDERFYAMQDANWNVVAICDPTGAVQERYAYTAYGVCSFLVATFTPLAGNVSAYDWTILYTGRVLDDESALYYYRSRTYNPSIGLFSKRDAPGRTNCFSLYEYVGSSPLSRVDPNGEVAVFVGDLEEWADRTERILHCCSCNEKKISEMRCELKSGPEYKPPGPWVGKQDPNNIQHIYVDTISLDAEFKNDPQSGICASCCEVRQHVWWSAGGPPIGPGFNPPSNFEPEHWYEDRDESGRYGHRSGRYSESTPQNHYFDRKRNGLDDPLCGASFHGEDNPNGGRLRLLGKKLRLKLSVIDVCRGGKTIGKTVESEVRW